MQAKELCVISKNIKGQVTVRLKPQTALLAQRMDIEWSVGPIAP